MHSNPVYTNTKVDIGWSYHPVSSTGETVFLQLVIENNLPKVITNDNGTKSVTFTNFCSKASGELITVFVPVDSILNTNKTKVKKSYFGNKYDLSKISARMNNGNFYVQTVLSSLPNQEDFNTFEPA